MKRRILFRSLVGTALLALPVVGFQMLEGSPPRAGGREPSARLGSPAILPPPIGILFVVNSTGDTHDVFPGDGVCADINGNCTLRAAIEEVNAGAGGRDGIAFDISTTDPGCSGGVCTIDLMTALPDLSITITITGPGADKVTVRQDASVRAFNVTTSGAVSLSGLTITGNGGGINNSGPGTVNVTNCTLSSNFTNQGGGGIKNSSSGTVNVTNCTLSGNNANFGMGANSGGGGIKNSSSTGIVNVTNCTISGNSTFEGFFGGGGIFNSGTLNVTNSTISGNSANSGPGGGIENEGFGNTGGTVNVTNCTISRNSASQFGGGIFNNGPLLNVTNSTLVGNSAPNNGGGIYHNSGTANVTNSTFFANSTPQDGGGIYVEVINNAILNVTNSTLNGNFANNGGGIFNASLQPSVKSSLIALNTAVSSGPDVSGIFASQGYNLIGKTDGSTGFTAATDLTGTIASPLDPKLDPSGLKDNGGPTKTIALLAGSPAIDKGTSNGLTGHLTTDQRGFGRPVDNPAIPNASGGDGSDIGAFELQQALLGNISTRAFVQTGDNVMIGGFIITGSGQKAVIVRAIGPSLVNHGITNPLQDPTLELHDHTGAVIAFNDNWMDAPNKQAIIDSGLAPSNNLESAILISLNPGAYTAIMRGANNGTGIGLVEAFDLDPTAGSKLGNISTRAFVQTGDNVMIGGLIVTGRDAANVIVRAIGPSLANFGITNALADPFLELHDANGALITSNDNWRSTQEAEIIATGLAPSNDLESAIVRTLTPGNYTAIVHGVNNTIGVALVEVFALN